MSGHQRTLLLGFGSGASFIDGLILYLTSRTVEIENRVLIFMISVHMIWNILKKEVRVVLMQFRLWMMLMISVLICGAPKDERVKVYCVSFLVLLEVLLLDRFLEPGPQFMWRMYFWAPLIY